MTTSQKAALSLLISVVLFGIFTTLAFTGLFDLLETRFYNPSIVNSISRDTGRNAGVVDRFFWEMENRFSETLKTPAVRRSFLPNQSAEDIFERSRIYGLLIESYRGIQWVRFVDSGGTRIHFSTYAPDIQSQDRMSVSYRNYDEPALPYERIAAAENETNKYIFDEKADRIIFSFPFHDSFDVYRGTALFAFSVNVLEDRLVSEGRIKIGQDISVISEPAGLLFGMSSAGETALPSQIASIWKTEEQKTTRLISPNSGLSLALISARTSQGHFIGRLVNEELFSFPQTMKIILLASFFLTVYLIIFLFFNLRQDSVTIVQNRLKQLQISMIEQFYEHKSDADWARWGRELEQRRDEINAQLKKGIKTAAGNKGKDIDALIDKSWDELLSVMGGKREEGQGLDEKKLEAVLSRILAALPAAGTAAGASVQIIPAANLPPAAAADAEPAAGPQPGEEIEVLEELEEADEVETLEAVEELEPIEAAETVEELETIEEAEPVEEPEEIEELEELTEPEEIGSVEDESGIKPPSPATIAELASQIEFSASPETEGPDDSSIHEDLEIVSPFSTMLSRFSDEDAAGPQPGFSREAAGEIRGDDVIFNGDVDLESAEGEAAPAAASGPEEIESLPGADDVASDGPPSAGGALNNGGGALYNGCVEKKNRTLNNSQSEALHEDVNRGLSLIYKPFERDENIEILEAIDDESGQAENAEDIIEEREGVHYISGDVLSPGPENAETLDKDFKKLVDEVI